MDVNVYGVVRVTNAFLPLLRRSPAPRIVNASSSMGSLGRQPGPIMAAYAPSKTFLNGITTQYARAFADTPIIVNAACPGLVATDFNGFAGDRTAAQGAATAVRLATLPDDGPRGGFFEDAGVVPGDAPPRRCTVPRVGGHLRGPETAEVSAEPRLGVSPRRATRRAGPFRPGARPDQAPDGREALLTSRALRT